MKRIILLFIFFILLSPTVFAQDMKLCVSIEQQFRFSYPEEWRLFTFKKDNVFVYNAVYLQDTIVNVGVAVTPIANKPDDKLYTDKSALQKFAGDELQKLKKGLPNVTLDNYSIVNFKGQKAILLSTSLPTLVDETYIIFTDSYRYEIFIAGTPKGIEQYHAVLDQSLNSFEILK